MADPIFKLHVVKGAGGRDTRVTWSNDYHVQLNADLASDAVKTLAHGIAQAETINLLDDVEIMRVVVKKVGNFAPLENRRRRKSHNINLTGQRASSEEIALPAPAHTEKIALPLIMCLLVTGDAGESDNARKVFRRSLTRHDVKISALGDYILDPAGWYGAAGPIGTMPAALLNALPPGATYVIPEALNPLTGSMGSRVITAWDEAGVVYHQLHNRRKSADTAFKEGVQRKINELAKEAAKLFKPGQSIVDLVGAALVTFTALKAAAMAEYLALPAAEQAAIELGIFALAA